MKQVVLKVNNEFCEKLLAWLKFFQTEVEIEEVKDIGQEERKPGLLKQLVEFYEDIEAPLPEKIVKEFYR